MTNSNLPLDMAAKSINARLGKADEMDNKANDHRLAAGLELIEARARVKAGEAGDIGWEKWCAENINWSGGHVRRVMRIAGASDPQAALEADRAQTAARVAGIRAKQADVRTSGQPKPANGDEEPPMSGAELEEYEVQRQQNMGGLDAQTCPTTPWQRAVARKATSDLNDAGPQVAATPLELALKDHTARPEVERVALARHVIEFLGLRWELIPRM